MAPPKRASNHGSRRAVSPVVEAPAPAIPPSAEQVADAAQLEAALEGDAFDPGEMPRKLSKVIAVLLEQLRRESTGAACNHCGRGVSNIDGVTKIGRTLAALSDRLAKLQPPEPPDPDAAPDMQAAARRGREKLHHLLDRALEGRSS